MNFTKLSFATWMLVIAASCFASQDSVKVVKGQVSDYYIPVVNEYELTGIVTINDGSLVTGIFHFVGSQYGRRFFLIGTVKVAGDDGRHVLSHFLHLGKDELDAFLACYLTIVVEVGVEVYHLLAGFFVFQYRPGTNTVVRSVPASFAKLLRVLT